MNCCWHLVATAVNRLPTIKPQNLGGGSSSSGPPHCISSVLTAKITIFDTCSHPGGSSIWGHANAGLDGPKNRHGPEPEGPTLHLFLLPPQDGRDACSAMKALIILEIRFSAIHSQNAVATNQTTKELYCLKPTVVCHQLHLGSCCCLFKPDSKVSWREAFSPRVENANTEHRDNGLLFGKEIKSHTRLRLMAGTPMP